MAKNIRKAMKAMQKQWKSTEANEGGFAKFKDGQYVARLDKAFMDVDQKDNLQIVYDLTIMDGEYAGKTMKKWGNLGEKSLEYTKGDLVKLDVDIPDDITDLPELLESLEGIYIAITLKTKEEGGYQNTFFNEVVDGDDFANGSDDEDEDEDEDEDNTSDEDDDDEDSDEDEEEEEEDEDDTIDVAKTSKSDLIDYCKEQGWKLGPKTKATVAKLRKYVTKKIEAMEEGDE